MPPATRKLVLRSARVRIAVSGLPGADTVQPVFVAQSNGRGSRCLYDSLSKLLRDLPFESTGGAIQDRLADSQKVQSLVLECLPIVQLAGAYAHCFDVDDQPDALAESLTEAALQATTGDLTEAGRELLERNRARMIRDIKGDFGSSVWVLPAVSHLFPEIAFAVVDATNRRESEWGTHPLPTHYFRCGAAVGLPGCDGAGPEALVAAEVSLAFGPPRAVAFLVRSGASAAGEAAATHFEPLLVTGCRLGGATAIAPGQRPPRSIDARDDRLVALAADLPPELRRCLPIELADAGWDRPFRVVPPAEVLRRTERLSAPIVALRAVPHQAPVPALSPSGTNVYPFVARRSFDCREDHRGRTQVWSLAPVEVDTACVAAVQRLVGPGVRWGGVGSFAVPGAPSATSFPLALSLLYGGGITPEAALARFVDGLTPLDCYCLPELRLRFGPRDWADGTFPHVDPAVIRRLVPAWTLSPAALRVVLRSQPDLAVVTVSASGGIAQAHCARQGCDRPVSRVVCCVVDFQDENGLTDLFVVAAARGGGGLVADLATDLRPGDRTADALLGALLHSAGCTLHPGRSPAPVADDARAALLPGAADLRAGRAEAAAAAVREAFERLAQWDGLPGSDEVVDELPRAARGFRAAHSVFRWPAESRARFGPLPPPPAEVVAHVVRETERLLAGGRAPVPPAAWGPEAHAPCLAVAPGALFRGAVGPADTAVLLELDAHEHAESLEPHPGLAPVPRVIRLDARGWAGFEAAPPPAREAAPPAAPVWREAARPDPVAAPREAEDTRAADRARQRVEREAEDARARQRAAREAEDARTADRARQRAAREAEDARTADRARRQPARGADPAGPPFPDPASLTPAARAALEGRTQLLYLVEHRLSRADLDPVGLADWYDRALPRDATPDDVFAFNAQLAFWVGDPEWLARAQGRTQHPAAADAPWPASLFQRPQPDVEAEAEVADAHGFGGYYRQLAAGRRSTFTVERAKIAAALLANDLSRLHDREHRLVLQLAQRFGD